MKKEVRLASKPEARRTSICAPERNTIRRRKVRCNQSCLRVSRKMPRRMSNGSTRKKCKPLTIQRIALRDTNQARFIYRCPRQREEYPVPGTPASHFSIDHDVHGRACFEFDVAHRAARSQRMFDMRTVIKTRQCKEQTQPADRAPADKFNEPVGSIRLRRDEHCAARVLAVVERQEKSAPPVPLLIVIATQRQGSPAQLHHAHENTEQITEIAKRLEHTIGQSGDISRKSNAQEIEGVDFAGGMCQAQKIDSSRAAFEKRLHRSSGSVLCKIAQEGIAGAERQESQCDALDSGASRKHTVEDFVSGAITTDGKKAPVPLIVSLARRSARTLRLIFNEAVRGKSSSSRTTPWTRL